jgi:type I restriction-modification system DNA methylase subunit
MRIADPACGTGGFLLAAHEWISKNHLLDPDEKRALRYESLKGWEIVDNTARLCVMNLLLHGPAPALRVRAGWRPSGWIVAASSRGR